MTYFAHSGLCHPISLYFLQSPNHLFPQDWEGKAVTPALAQEGDNQGSWALTALVSRCPALPASLPGPWGCPESWPSHLSPPSVLRGAREAQLPWGLELGHLSV